MLQFLISEITVGVFPDSFENGDDIEILFLALDLATARENRAPVNEDSGAVHATHGHDAGGHVLIAAADGNEAVHAFAADNGLDGIRDDLAGNERVFHPLRAHGNAIRDGDGIENEAFPACRIHAFFRFDRELINVDVARRDLAPCGGDTDLRFRKIFFFKSHCIKHCAAWRTVGAIKHQTGKRAFLVIHRRG